ncbi:MAG: HEAT repeat domain-containing protein [Candidatus Eremiobacteraeota bacterium]|nr:HEAT repeat domain-containing protein [Candidatus Eremiobacteraeota bacterium]
MNLHDDTGAHRAFALPGASFQYGPDKTVAVEHIDLHLTPNLAKRRLAGVCTTTVRALDEDVHELALNAVDLDVSAVTRDKQPLKFARRNDRLIVTFDPAIAAGKSASFAVTYQTTNPRHGLFFVEPDDAYPNKIAHAWTQSQDQNARFWFPCLDYPHEKQSTSATIVVPKGQFALSNGKLISRTDDAQNTTFRYEQTIPHSTYLMTFVVGPFVEIEQRAAGVPVSYYVLPGREADGERAFGKAPEMIETFGAKIGTPYPYARYSQIAVSDFIFGGMENTTATTQTDRTLHDARAHLDFSSDPLVSHELAHQWFGDLLTCRDWSHAWLNEGFATYFEAIWRESDLGYDEYLYDCFTLVAAYVDEDSDRYRRPIVCNHYQDPIELFDRHLYQKGGAVLHMLRGELGEKRFWRSIERYVKDNAERNVETIDLIRAIEGATGRNMRGYFDQWVFRGGHPEIEVSVGYDSKRKAAKITIDQKQTVDEKNPAYRFAVDLGFCFELPQVAASDFGSGVLPGEKRIRVQIESAHETFFVPLDAEPKLIRFDPGAFLLAGVTYKFGTDFAIASLQGDPDCVARIRAGRELAKDGSKSAREALGRTFKDDPFWGTLEEIAGALGRTHAPWAKQMLLQALEHTNLKVRRAVVAALGEFHDSDVAEALLPIARNDKSYLVQAAALHALGKTRDNRALQVLLDALKVNTWNGAIESGAARGLGELTDERALEPLIAASKLGREEGLRRTIPGVLVRLAELIETQRSSVVDALIGLLDDPMFLVQLSAITAVERLGDARALGTLERLRESAFDGRVRRDAVEAMVRIREAQKVPAQITGLRTDLDALREDQRKLQEKIEEALARS